MSQAPNQPTSTAPFRVRRDWITLQDRLLIALASLAAVAVMICGAAAAARAAAIVSTFVDPATASEVKTSIYREVGAVVFGVVAVLLPVIYLFVSRAFSPVRRISAAAQNVAEGHFETVDVRSGDTLGRLGQSFNEMVSRLAEQKCLADDAAAKLIEANLNLERKVADRTSAIQAASRQLEAEIAEKEDFLRAVSHDLNAPLRNIDGMVTMLKRKHGSELGEAVLHRLDRIKHNVGVETELIGDLLDLSRIKSRRDEMEPVNLTALIEDLKNVFENDFRENEIEFIVESKLPVLLAEKGRIRQVFQNLIDNAIKYMGDGEVRRIAVGCLLRREEATFWVRDTGIGITPDQADKVFYVFRRGTNHTGVAGKGVGLASVKSIVETYQGRIWAEPNMEGGTTFTFTVNAQHLKQDVRLFASRDAVQEVADDAELPDRTQQAA